MWIPYNNGTIYFAWTSEKHLLKPGRPVFLHQHWYQLWAFLLVRHWFRGADWSVGKVLERLLWRSCCGLFMALCARWSVFRRLFLLVVIVRSWGTSASQSSLFCISFICPVRQQRRLALRLHGAAFTCKVQMDVIMHPLLFFICDFFLSFFAALFELCPLFVSL